MKFHAIKSLVALECRVYSVQQVLNAYFAQILLYLLLWLSSILFQSDLQCPLLTNGRHEADNYMYEGVSANFLILKIFAALSVTRQDMTTPHSSSHFTICASQISARFSAV